MNRHSSTDVPYEYLSILWERLHAVANARAKHAGKDWPIYTEAEAPVRYLQDVWRIVHEPGPGFTALCDCTFDAAEAAVSFDHVGLPRVAELYRFAHALLPADWARLQWKAEDHLPPWKLELQALLTERVRRAELEITLSLIRATEALLEPKDSGS